MAKKAANPLTEVRPSTQKSRRARPVKKATRNQITDEVASAMGGLIKLVQESDGEKLADKVFGEDHDCSVYDDLCAIVHVVDFFHTALPLARREMRERIAAAIKGVRDGKDG